LLLVVVVAVVATGGGGGGITVDPQGDVRLRQYQVDWYPLLHPRAVSLRGIQFKKNQTEAQLDAVVFDITTINQVSILFNYFRSQESISNGSIAEETNTTSINGNSDFGFAVRTFFVYEYVDYNGIPGYQFNTSDNITGLYDLSSPHLQWKDLEIDTTNVTVNGTFFKIFYIRAQTTDDVFTLTFTVCGTPIHVNSSQITPDSTKFDVTIRWFTDKHVKALWTTGPSNAALFPNATNGLMAGMASTVNRTILQTAANGGTDPFMSMNQTGFNGFFSWVRTVEIVQDNVTSESTVDVEVIDVLTGKREQNGENNETKRNEARGNNPPAGTYQQSLKDIEMFFDRFTNIKLFFFSFEGFRPSAIFWDPTQGSDNDYTDLSVTTSPMNGMTSNAGPITSGTGVAPLTSGQAPTPPASAANGLYACVSLIVLCICALLN